VDLYKPAMAEHGHEISTNLQPVLIDADLSLLNRTIANLLDNEIVHLPPGCRINISVHAKPGKAEFTIEDNGPGFPAELRSHAFERFVKGQHSVGHGLGLAFVDAVARAHGGRVEIADREGGGVLLTLTLNEAVTENASR
jgi:signal transduction histidine kinase